MTENIHFQSLPSNNLKCLSLDQLFIVQQFEKYNTQWHLKNMFGLSIITNLIIKRMHLVIFIREMKYRHSSFNTVFGPGKNRVKGNPRYRRSILVLKPQNGEFESSKSTFLRIFLDSFIYFIPFHCFPLCIQTDCCFLKTGKNI